MTTIDDGHYGEDMAVEYLASQGLEIIDRNFRNGKQGEVDIVAKQGELYIFVEVKAFKKGGYLRPAQAVTVPKQIKIRNAANVFLVRHGLKAVPCRFDVVEIYMVRGGMDEINWIRDAFR